MKGRKMDFPFAESALSERRNALDLLNEDLCTAQLDVTFLRSNDEALRRNIVEKDNVIKSLRVLNRELEEERL